jgi:hypothetical protein
VTALFFVFYLLRMQPKFRAVFHRNRRAGMRGIEVAGETTDLILSDILVKLAANRFILVVLSVF